MLRGKAVAALLAQILKGSRAIDADIFYNGEGVCWA